MRRELSRNAHAQYAGGVLGSAATLPRLVTGKYDARSDTATLKLVGFDAGVGNKMVMKRVTFSAGTLSGGRIVYQIYGQKGRIELD